MTFVERRKHVRYPCDLAVEVRPAGEQGIYPGTLADICLGGCYVSTVSPLPTGVAVYIYFKAPAEGAMIAGRIVTSLPGSGMGIEFTVPPQSEYAIRLKAIIELLDGEVKEDAGLRT